MQGLPQRSAQPEHQTGPRWLHPTQALRLVSWYANKWVRAGCELRDFLRSEQAGGAQCPLDPYFIMPDKCECVDFQIFKLQELPDAVPQGEMPRHMQLFCDRYLCERIVPGNRVTVLGIYSIKKAGKSSKVKKKKKKISTVAILYFIRFIKKSFRKKLSRLINADASWLWQLPEGRPFGWCIFGSKWPSFGQLARLDSSGTTGAGGFFQLFIEFLLKCKISELYCCVADFVEGADRGRSSFRLPAGDRHPGGYGGFGPEQQRSGHFGGGGALPQTGRVGQHLRPDRPQHRAQHLRLGGHQEGHCLPLIRRYISCFNSLLNPFFFFFFFFFHVNGFKSI